MNCFRENNVFIGAIGTKAEKTAGTSAHLILLRAEQEALQADAETPMIKWSL